MAPTTAKARAVHMPPASAPTAQSGNYLRGSRLEPALAPAVVLDVAERTATLAADAEVEFLHVLVLAQARGLPVEHDAAVLQDVAVMGEAQRHVGVLLREQARHPPALAHVPHHLPAP